MQFHDRDSASLFPLSLACGQCIGCRVVRAREWAIRCAHESSLHAHNSFVTLTYAPNKLPEHGSLRPRDFTLFMKRLRKVYGKVRYLMSGEYGETTFRPHYHALLFGVDFYESVRLVDEREGYSLFSSPVLDAVWSNGAAVIGALTQESASYVCKYTVKKVNGDVAHEKYRRLCPFTGEETYVVPEFARMSLRPGIGEGWYRKWKSDCFPSDSVVYNGRLYPVPDYYFRLLERESPQCAETVANKRRAAVRKHAADLTEDRLSVREEIAISKHKLFGATGAL